MMKNYIFPIGEWLGTTGTLLGNDEELPVGYWGMVGTTGGNGGAFM